MPTDSGRPLRKARRVFIHERILDAKALVCPGPFDPDFWPPSEVIWTPSWSLPGAKDKRLTPFDRVGPAAGS